MKKMLVDSREPEESRIAVMENGRLDEIYIERVGRPTAVGNIYKGRVVNIEPGIQAAFVDIGMVLKGFLHVSDVVAGALHGPGDGGPKRGSRKRTIQSLLRKGAELVVQVTKDPMGKKGPALTTQVSLPGRYLVLMPFLPKHGVSRKIEDEKERKRLKETLASLSPPQTFGFIVRTAGKQRRKADLQRDLKYLVRVWKAVAKRADDVQSPAVLYQETDLMVRTIRDFFTPDVQSVLVDTPEGFRRAQDFFRIAMPRHADRVKLYDGDEPIFQRFKVEPELAKVFDPRVTLPSGGTLVIEPTEAMVTIDVNSGRFTGAKNTEEMALKINQEAAREVARQLMLRDLGGLIVVDFIDMRQETNLRQVEKTFREALRNDRARSHVLRMSKFCLMEMTRQRLRPSLPMIQYDRCAACGGTGVRLNVESLSARILRRVRFAFQNEAVHRVEVHASEEMAMFLLNEKRARLAELESLNGKDVLVLPVGGGLEAFEILAFDEGGKVVKGV
ncbi:MAG: Rne/Rng family ribonuclease [Planctomycetota bacterium]|jgi:ribonuclease E